MTTTDGGDEHGALRVTYERRIADLRLAFENTGDGLAAIAARAGCVDETIQALWTRERSAHPAPLEAGLCIVAVGGYGRRQLFPHSDIDLLFCSEKSVRPETTAAVRRITQALWDCGMHLASFTRTLGEQERFSASNPEGSLALLDMRFLAGDQATFAALSNKIIDRRSARDTRTITSAIGRLTRERHARFGHTLFHLEPNVKDAPGGLRDANVCTWLTHLIAPSTQAPTDDPFHEAFAFLSAVRVFLHLRHGRDDNTLDWHAQDEAARLAIGLPRFSANAPPPPDPAYWMRIYFRHARAVERELARELERTGQREKPPSSILRAKAPSRSGFVIADGVLQLKQAHPDLDPAQDPEVVLTAFGVLSETGVDLAPAGEERIEAALPLLAAHLEDGPRLWSRLCRVLNGRYAGKALRLMHALGLLELILPEFHGIDALVIRDAYHRYTVDEHTFVLIDALHNLADIPPPNAPEWRIRFRSLLRDLPHPELLYLAALLHDTGKSRSTSAHAHASAQLAEEVAKRLELEPYDRRLVVRLIERHLEMSAALRRDIFDNETVRVFAEKIGTHDLLRMLTLFTYADISAVHPDALTPWKAENLWRLSMAAANQMDRTVDEDRVHVSSSEPSHEAQSIARALNLKPAQQTALVQFLEGIPERYLRTRSPEIIRQHLALAESHGSSTLVFHPAPGVNEVTIVTGDRSRLFADLTGGLSAWGMNIVSAEAFSNAHGTVVDSFRFSDPHQTLELNPEERDRFQTSIAAIATGSISVEDLLRRRRYTRTRPRRVIETRVDCDNTASRQSTLVQVIAQDEPGLLRAISLALSDFGCSVEVALIDTEGEMAIDVFYVTFSGNKLNEAQQRRLGQRIEDSIQANAL